MRYRRSDHCLIDVEEKGISSNFSDEDRCDSEAINNELLSMNSSSFELERGIDHDTVHEIVGEINKLRNGLLVLLVIFITISSFIALDDYISNRAIVVYDRNEQTALALEEFNKTPHPHSGHKLQINASAFTVNDFECLQIDTGTWPSERVHCELRKSSEDVNGTNGDYDDDVAVYDIVVEHFDDDNCQEPNAENPVVRRAASGCYYFEAYNHSYNDVCHMNRTLTISAFDGPGCLTPMPNTAVNVLPEDAQ